MSFPGETVLPHEVDDVTGYIFDHYLSLLTPQERNAYMIAIYQRKVEHSEDSHPAAFAVKRFLAASPDGSPLLQDGAAAFYRRVADRILHEHADAVFLNRCPKCNTLCRTPQACLCPNPDCHHTWYEKRERNP